MPGSSAWSPKRETSSIVHSSRSRILASVAALAVGAVLGVLGPLLNIAGGPTGHVASLVLSAGWAWAALAFCVGLTRRSKMESAILAPASLIIAVIAYYATKITQGDYLAYDHADPSGKTTYIDWADALSKAAVWCLVACILGSLLGLAGNLARRHGIRGLPFRVLVPLVAIVDTSMRLRFDAPLQGAIPTTTWNVIRFAAVAVIVILAGHTVITTRSAERTHR
nr:DUF6518 family protein [Streptomyces sp. SID5468]